MRISIETIEEAEQRMNPTGDSTLVLRGRKIPVIENLGATKDLYACIDLTDNDIVKIPIIPKLTKLRTLLLGNNVISQVHPNAFDSVTNLTSLVLSGNKISSLAELCPLGNLKYLERLSLIDNPVAKEAHYRFFVIHVLGAAPTFRYLDFQRITDEERKQTKEFFLTTEGKALLKTTGNVEH